MRSRGGIVAAALAAACVAATVLLGALGAGGPIWVVQAALALAAAVAGHRAGGTSHRNPVAFAALVLGVSLFALFLVFALFEG